VARTVPDQTVDLVHFGSLCGLIGCGRTAARKEPSASVRAFTADSRAPGTPPAREQGECQNMIERSFPHPQSQTTVSSAEMDDRPAAPRNGHTPCNDPHDVASRFPIAASQTTPRATRR